MGRCFKDLSRRQFLAGSSAALLGSSYKSVSLASEKKPNDRKFLFVICASGGASIIDSFMAQSRGVASYQNLVKPNGSVFSAAPVLSNSIQGSIPLGNGYAQADFIRKHGLDMAVMTVDVSSVNHQVAAKRAITGDNIFGGRTLMEAVSMQYGADLPLANLMLAGGGYASHGDDLEVPDAARAHLVSDPLMFAFSTHGSRGISTTLSQNEIEAVRGIRKQLEKMSMFYEEHKNSAILDRYLENRDRVVQSLERGDAITRLMMVDPANQSDVSLKSSPDIDLLRNTFSNLAKDPFEARLGLAFLAVKHGISTAVTVAPSPSALITADGTPNAPIAFDWSHVDHRGAQNAMWSYILKGTSNLIDLLKATDIGNDPAQGKMWSRSLIYIATEFGRDKIASGGSGHHTNNGVVFISPMISGNRIFGGVDPNTGLTFGFDRSTGAPAPGVQMKERDIYSAIATALGIDFSNRTNMKVLVRS